MNRDAEYRIDILEQQVSYLLDHFKPRKHRRCEPIAPPPPPTPPRFYGGSR